MRNDEFVSYAYGLGINFVCDCVTNEWKIVQLIHWATFGKYLTWVLAVRCVHIESLPPHVFHSFLCLHIGVECIYLRKYK